jgi:sugar lactone lactonase YvrE
MSSPTPQPRVLLDDLVFPESPRWHDGRLWFCDWGAGEVIAVDLHGTRELIARVNSFPFCIDWLPDGHLLVVSAREKRLLRRERDGSLVAYADLAGLSEKPWNEIVVDRRGNAYVNNIGFDYPQEEFAPGIVALVTPQGALRQVADGLAFPNGMVVTPDNSTLIVAESYSGKFTAFDIGPDGGLTNRRTWAAVDGSAPDGICLDTENAVWYADVPKQQCVRVRAGGQVLQTIQADRGCFACALGGAERRILFITANEWQGPASLDGKRMGQVLAVRVDAPGAGWP